MTDPIWIRCEGSGCSPTTGLGDGTEALGMCAMCGQWHPLQSYRMPEHVRDDIIARIKRGDFDDRALDGAGAETGHESC